MTKSIGLKVLRWSWMVQTVVLFIISIMATFMTDALIMGRWMQVLPLLTGITTAEGLIGFGGSAIKRGQNGKDS